MFRTEYIDILWYFWLVRYLGPGPSYHRSKHQLEASEGSFRSLDPRKCPTALSGLYKEEDEDHAHPCGKGEGKLFDSSILWPYMAIWFFGIRITGLFPLNHCWDCGNRQPHLIVALKEGRDRISEPNDSENLQRLTWYPSVIQRAQETRS